MALACISRVSTLYTISYACVVVTLMSGRTCITLAPHILNAAPWLGLTSPEMTQLAMWHSSCASVCRNLLSVSVTLIARSTWHKCSTPSPFLTLRHVARPAVLRSVLDQRTSTPGGRPGSVELLEVPSGVRPRQARRKTVRSKSAMSWSGSEARWAAVRMGSELELEGVAVGAFLRVALGRVAGVVGVAGARGVAEAEGRAGVKDASGGRASSSESLSVRMPEGLRALPVDALGEVGTSRARAGVGASGVAIGLSLRGVGSLQPPRQNGA